MSGKNVIEMLSLHDFTDTVQKAVQWHTIFYHNYNQQNNRNGYNETRKYMHA